MCGFVLCTVVIATGCAQTDKRTEILFENKHKQDERIINEN